MGNDKRLVKRNEQGEVRYATPCKGNSVQELYEEEREKDKAIMEKLCNLEDKIENGTLKKVVRCKDCVYFQPEYIEMENKERRPYTEEEIKNGKFVTMEKGINCGSRCERFRYWNENQYPVWFNENDFCSYGKLKEQQNER